MPRRKVDPPEEVNALRAELIKKRAELVGIMGKDEPIAGMKIDGKNIPDLNRMNDMKQLDTIRGHIDRIQQEINRRSGIVVELDSDDEGYKTADDSQIQPISLTRPSQQQPQQNLIVYQDPALLNHFERIERSTLIDLDRDLKNAGVPDQTITNMTMDEKQEYAKLIREMNFGSASKLVGSAPNPKFKDLLDNRYTDQYIFEANKTAVLADKPLKLPPIEELWRRHKELKPIPASEIRYSKFINFKQLNPFEKFALLHHDNRPGVTPRYKNQGAPQKDAPIVYGGKLHLEKRIPTNPTRLVV